MSPMPPARRPPGHSEPIACAASSIEREPEALRELAEAVHVRALAVQVHRHDRAHATAGLAVVELVGAALAVLLEELLDQVARAG